MTGRPRSHPRPRAAGGRVLATRQLIALLIGVHPDTIRREFEPVACDVRSRANLYDVAEIEARL